MTKSELVDKVAAGACITKEKAEQAVKAFTEAIGGIATGDKLVLHRFGTFKKVIRKEKVGRNPKTGETLKVPAKPVLRFTASKKDK